MSMHRSFRANIVRTLFIGFALLSGMSCEHASQKDTAKDLKGLYTKYSRQNPNFMSMRDTELKFMRYYVARYSRLIDGHIKYLMMNRF